MKCPLIIFHRAAVIISVFFYHGNIKTYMIINFPENSIKNDQQSTLNNAQPLHINTKLSRLTFSLIIPQPHLALNHHSNQSHAGSVESERFFHAEPTSCLIGATRYCISVLRSIYRLLSPTLLTNMQSIGGRC